MSKQWKILIVDDCVEDSLDFRRCLLSDPDNAYTIWYEQTGKQGLALYKTIRPDCVLLDYKLSDMDGLAFLDVLLTETNDLYLPVVMLTKHGNEAIAVEAMKCGIQDYLVKGTITPENLRRAVHNAIQKVTMQQQLNKQHLALARKNRELQALAEENRVRLWQEQSARAELEAILTTMTDGVIVFDDKGAIAYANAAARRIFAFATDSTHETRPLHERAVLLDVRDEQGRPLPLEYWPPVQLLNGKMLTDTNTMDMRIRALDGHEVQLNIGGTPIYNQEGHIIGAIALYRDVTERRLLEREAAERANLVQAVFDAEVDGIFVCGADGKVTRANRTALELFGLDAVPGLSHLSRDERIAELNMRDERGQLLTRESSPLSRVLRGEVLTGSHAVDLMTTTQDGRILLISITGAPLRNVEGQIVGAILIARDVTARRRLERQTQEINQRMDEFIGIASHELRNPLTAIKGYIQLAARRLRKLRQRESALIAEWAEDFTSLQKTLEYAQQQITFQDRLVEELLDVSRIQANKLELRKVMCDLVEIVHAVVREQRQVAPVRTISIESGAQILSIFADPDRIKQVVTNYLTNALKYSVADKPVLILLCKEEQIAYLAVQDEGQGIPLEHQAHIWERFYRVEGVKVQSASGVGLGLGLHICRAIIERHQGQVGVESTPGKGSTFWFRLPLAEANETRT